MMIVVAKLAIAFVTIALIVIDIYYFCSKATAPPHVLTCTGNIRIELWLNHAQPSFS